MRDMKVNQVILIIRVIMKIEKKGGEGKRIVEIYFADWIPERFRKHTTIQNLGNFVETLHDKNNITFKTTSTNTIFGDLYPGKTEILCGWCRNGFETRPMGVPIKYTNGFYWMDGCFCSCNCCLAYLLEHEEKKKEKQDPLYRDSIGLLFQLSEKMEQGVKLMAANDWKILEGVGTGKMTIEQFRMNFMQFARTTNIKFIPCPVYYQKK